MVIDGFSAPPIHFLLKDIMSHLHKEVQYKEPHKWFLNASILFLRYDQLSLFIEWFPLPQILYLWLVQLHIWSILSCIVTMVLPGGRLNRKRHFCCRLIFGSNYPFVTQLQYILQQLPYLTLNLSPLCVAGTACLCKLTEEADGPK